VARELKFCGPRKGPDFERVLPIFRGWSARCLTRRGWHKQLWPTGQLVICIWPGSVAWLHTPALRYRLPK